MWKHKKFHIERKMTQPTILNLETRHLKIQSYFYVHLYCCTQTKWLFTWFDCDYDLFSQLIGCMEFSIAVIVTPCEHLHWHSNEVICCHKNHSRNRTMWTAFNTMYSTRASLGNVRLDFWNIYKCHTKSDMQMVLNLIHTNTSSLYIFTS